MYYVINQDYEILAICETYDIAITVRNCISRAKYNKAVGVVKGE